jgi:parallel beta-helix repeat protein
MWALKRHAGRRRLAQSGVGEHLVFDGIVVQDSSHNRVASNVVDGARRFGLRMTGASEANFILGNTFEHALLGVYLYAGPTGNTLTRNRFAANREDLRIRSDAPRNTVSPVPPKSEVAP